jgi:glycosyltransferase involved in cell wall biosynthesis
MRIALVVHKFPPSSMGGTENYTLNLAQELARHGHQVSVFYRAEPPVAGQQMIWEDRQGFQACRVSRGFEVKTASAPAKFLDTFYSREIERAFARFLDQSRPDLVHFQHVMWLSYRLIAMAKQRGLPALLTLHDYWFLCANSQLIWPDAQVCQGKAWDLNCARCALAQAHWPGGNLLRPVIAPAFRLRDALVRGAALRADRWIAPSHFLIEQYVKAGFPAERCVYLENGIDVERIQRYPHQPSAGGAMRFTYLGSLAWQKGVHIVVQAFRGIPAEKAVLRIYGDPAVFPDYAASLQQMADPDNTSFAGAVPNEEVGRVLAETDVLIVPSLWYENSPMVIQEASVAGVPVMASRIGALIEKLQCRTDGILCAPGEVENWRESLLSVIQRAPQMENLRDVSPCSVPIQVHTSSLENIYHCVRRGRNQ